MFDSEIANALEHLRKSGTILYPTDTIWGLGCDATDQRAVDSIFNIKQRDPSKSLLVLLDDVNKLQRYVRQVPEVCWDLIEYADKPLTIVYPGGYNLASGVCAEDGTVGIRITSDPFCKALIGRLNKPLVPHRQMKVASKTLKVLTKYQTISNLMSIMS